MLFNIFCSHKASTLSLASSTYGDVVECRCGRCGDLLEWAYVWETNKKIVRDFFAAEKAAQKVNDAKWNWCKK